MQERKIPERNHVVKLIMWLIFNYPKLVFIISVFTSMLIFHCYSVVETLISRLLLLGIWKSSSKIALIWQSDYCLCSTKSCSKTRYSDVFTIVEFHFCCDINYVYYIVLAPRRLNNRMELSPPENGRTMCLFKAKNDGRKWRSDYCTFLYFL